MREIFRIIDANLNRSREGLRVCEEITRFVFNLPSLTKDLKDVRHKASAEIKNFPKKIASLLESRDVEKDTGKYSQTKSEMKRSGAADIFFANLERVKESLRVLEEFSKLYNKNMAARFSVLRFKVYDIEKKAARKIR